MALQDIVKKGSTDRSVTVRIIDSTAGTPETGVVFNTAGIDLWYRREGAAVSSITEATLASLTTAHADGGFLHVSHGEYRLDLPDAAFATGAEYVDFGGTVTGMIVIGGRIRLVDFDLEDGVRLGLTALPNAAADAAGGLPISDAGGLPMDDIVQLNATARDNLEDQYDTTGLIGDAFPATQAQIGSIANVGSAVYKAPQTYTLTTGTQSSGTVADVEELNGVTHEHTDAAGVLLIEYHHLIGSGTPSSIQITGYVSGSNDTILVAGYDWVAGAYKQVGSIVGQNGTPSPLPVYSFNLLLTMVGSGADEGKVDIKLYATSGLTSSTTRIDQMLVAFNQGQDSYDNGSIWYDSSASNTNTVVGIDGTSRNPVSTSAAVLTLAASTGLHRIECAPGSSLTLSAAYEGYKVIGNGSILILNNQNIGGSVFEDFASITGIATTTANQAFFRSCVFGTATLPPNISHLCGYGGTITYGSAGGYINADGYSTIGGASSPVFTKTPAVAITAEYRRWTGGNTQSGLQAGDVITVGGPDAGTITLNGADATVEIRGINKAVVDNLTGSPAVTYGGIDHGDVVDILADTNELQADWADGGRLDLIQDIIAEDTTTDIPALIATAQDDLDTITGADGAALASTQQSITFQPLTITAGDAINNITLAGTGTSDGIAFTRSGSGDPFDANFIGQINATVDTALTDYDSATGAEIANVQTDLDNLNLGVIYGAAVTGTLSTTQATTDLTGYTDDQLIGRVIIVTSGPAEGEGSDITDSAATGGLLTFTAMTLAMSNGNTFKIV